MFQSNMLQGATQPTADRHNLRAGMRRNPFILAGASLVAIVAAGYVGPACAQDTSPAAGASDAQSAGDVPANSGSKDIVVTGRRAALQAADERKRRSETIIDSIVADDAGK